MYPVYNRIFLYKRKHTRGHTVIESFFMHVIMNWEYRRISAMKRRRGECE